LSDKTTLSSTININSQRISLIDFLSTRFKYHKPDEWERLILDMEVLVNNANSSPDYILLNKDIVTYSVILREPPVNTDIRIIHNEDSFLVAHKPGNLPVHSYGRYIKNTFIHLLRDMMLKENYKGYLNPVHRLDRDTSGLIIVAKTKEAGSKLNKQFREGSVKKEYIAVVRGLIQAGTLELEGWIGNDSDSIVSIKQRVVPEGAPGAKRSFTRFETISYAGDYTIVRCLPETGRTNQIRVHLAHLNHSLAGDKLYGRSDEEFLEYYRAAEAGQFDPLPWMDAPRHMLHACAVSFSHPVTGELVSFDCQMPEDMNDFIEFNKIC
jgi:RluA family pseudouridine synthase